MKPIQNGRGHGIEIVQLLTEMNKDERAQALIRAAKEYGRLKRLAELDEQDAKRKEK